MLTKKITAVSLLFMLICYGCYVEDPYILDYTREDNSIGFSYERELIYFWDAGALDPVTHSLEEVSEGRFVVPSIQVLGIFEELEGKRQSTTGTVIGLCAQAQLYRLHLTYAIGSTIETYIGRTSGC
jgi:hypothetical protein